MPEGANQGVGEQESPAKSEETNSRRQFANVHPKLHHRINPSAQQATSGTEPGLTSMEVYKDAATETQSRALLRTNANRDTSMSSSL